jgi:hypothetical protein
LIFATVTTFDPLVVASPLSSELVHVCVLPAKRQIPAPGLLAFTTLAVTTPLSCIRQVVLDTVQSIKCPVVGTVAKPLMLFDVVAPLPQIV